METTALTDSFLAALADADGDGTTEVLPASDLEAALAERLATARAAWPDVDVTGAAFAAHLGRVVAAGAPAGDVVARLAKLRTSDLYLALGCAHGNPAAVQAFEDNVLNVVPAALSRLRVPPATVDEIRQQVRQRLLVPRDDRPPRVADYTGRGDLRNWVRATAVRTGLNFLRKHRREVAVSDDDRIMSAFPSPEDDPELAHMKGLYRRQFKQAFVDALASLDKQDIALLRLYHVDDLTIDEVGAIYGVHRVTAFRRITRARERLVASTRQTLQAALAITPTELESVMRLIHSQLDISVATYLK